MTRFDGSAALKLDFGPAFGKAGKAVTTTAAVGGGRPGLRLAVSGALRGPEKYKTLDHRRRQAQIKARRVLDLFEEGK